MKILPTIFLLTWLAATTHAQQITSFEKSANGDLTARWNLAQKTMRLAATERAIIAYSFTQMMPEDSWTGHFFARDREDVRQICEVIYGIKSELPWKRERMQSVRDVARKELGQQEKEMPKEVVVFFHYQQIEKGTFEIRDISLSNIELQYKFDNAPIYWLGHAEKEHSFGLLKRMFETSQDLKLRKHLIRVIGRHDAREVVPFLQNIILGTEEKPQRKNQKPDKLLNLSTKFA